jgi:hypothetical protein
MAGVPNWSQALDPIAVWCELAKQDDINAGNWAGPTWPGPLPPSGDQGYGTQASGFQVTQVSLFLGVPNNDFIFTITTPTGQRPPSIRRGLAASRFR